MIYRAFGAADALNTAWAMRRLAHRRGLVFLVGADARLAMAAKADGVHLPERLMHRTPALKRSHPTWYVTVAAHDRKALLRAGRLGADAALVSAVFKSRSASAGAPLGAIRFAGLIRGARTPVIALGGVDADTAPRLIGTGARGLAAVDGLRMSEA